MSDQPITQAEMIEMFGSKMPLEAVELMLNAPDDMTLGEMRSKLREMAAPRPRQLARAVIRDACADPNMWATHGMPSEDKLLWLENVITEAIETALREHQ